MKLSSHSIYITSTLIPAGVDVGRFQAKRKIQEERVNNAIKTDQFPGRTLHMIARRLHRCGLSYKRLGPQSMQVARDQPSDKPLCVHISKVGKGSKAKGKGKGKGKQALPATTALDSICNQKLSPELNKQVKMVLGEVVKFDHRAYSQNPLKHQAKKRIVCGLREVMKAVSVKRAKCVIFATVIEGTLPGFITLPER
eukprot:TRINITY_DN6255_c0_g1_i1.p1 TRINITY_DN6255_c0_g1~~TRINITY_DN6255_c0_g1_i1.p1  ORF type:complete len:197 (+),score=19.46 TRINITY_DN6255_c0_g1_i1:37-627(+)